METPSKLRHATNIIFLKKFHIISHDLWWSQPTLRASNGHWHTVISYMNLEGVGEGTHVGKKRPCNLQFLSSFFIRNFQIVTKFWRKIMLAPKTVRGFSSHGGHSQNQHVITFQDFEGISFGWCLGLRYSHLVHMYRQVNLQVVFPHLGSYAQTNQIPPPSYFSSSCFWILHVILGIPCVISWFVGYWFQLSFTTVGVEDLSLKSLLC